MQGEIILMLSINGATLLKGLDTGPTEFIDFSKVNPNSHFL